MNNFDSILYDLEVISMIKENGKICFKNGKISLEPIINNGGIHGFASWIILSTKRRLTQDSREFSILAIQNLVLRLEIILSCPLSHSEKNRISEYCGKAITGLENLKYTYKHDAQSVACIEIIIQKLNLIIQNQKD
jgi:hypothetical protein